MDSVEHILVFPSVWTVGLVRETFLVQSIAVSLSSESKCLLSMNKGLGIILLYLHRLYVEDNTEPKISVHGFANYTDVVAHDLVPWTPLRTSTFTTSPSTVLFGYS